MAVVQREKEMASEAIQVKLLFFAKSRELVGGLSQATMDVDAKKAVDLSYDQVLDLICQHFSK